MCVRACEYHCPFVFNFPNHEKGIAGSAGEAQAQGFFNVRPHGFIESQK